MSDFLILSLFLIVFSVAFIVANLHIVSDREVWVVERLGRRRFVRHGARFLIPGGVDKVICVIPRQPQILEFSSEGLNIPDGTCEIVVSVEFWISSPETAYQRILTNEATRRLEVEQQVDYIFVSAAREAVKKLPIESLCEEEEDNALSVDLRRRIEKDMRARGLELVDGASLKVLSVELDSSAKEARRIRYQSLKQAAAKAIHAQGQGRAVQQLAQLLGVSQKEAMGFYSELEVLAGIKAGGNIVISDVLGARLLRIGRRSSI